MKERQPTFILDGMLGSLARWLRLLGFDTLYCKARDDKEILGATGNRILLTRDKELFKRAHNQGFQVINPGSGSISNMLQRLKEELDLTFTIDPFKSRCSLCNAPLEPVTRDAVRDRVPPNSLRRHQQFWECPNPHCKQVYWQGRHWNRIRRTINELADQS